MSGLFINENDVFTIDIWVAVSQKGDVFCNVKAKSLKELIGDEDLDIEKYTVTFKKPSFGSILEMTDNIIDLQYGENNQIVDVNPVTIRLKTLVYLIKDWDFINEEDEVIPPTEENIRKLNPVIVAALGIELDIILGDEVAPE